jgi:DNA-binding NarL/FixJ family response regulator
MRDIEVVGEAEDGSRGLAAALAIEPDVVLLDVNMPVMGGVETVKSLRRSEFKGRILMLTISRQDEDLLGAITAGADGYLLKNVEPAELKNAIERVHAGKGVLSPEVTRTVMQSVRTPLTTTPVSGLSPREKEVLIFLSQGLTTSQIAEQLVISGNTVKTHVRHILEKLDAANRAEAVRIAIQLGLIRQT